MSRMVFTTRRTHVLNGPSAASHGAKMQSGSAPRRMIQAGVQSSSQRILNPGETSAPLKVSARACERTSYCAYLSGADVSPVFKMRTPRAETLPLVVCLFNTVCVCLSPHDFRTHPPTPRRPSCPRARSITFSDRGGNGSKVSPRGANGSACCPGNLQTECGGPRTLRVRACERTCYTYNYLRAAPPCLRWGLMKSACSPAPPAVRHASHPPGPRRQPEQGPVHARQQRLEARRWPGSHHIDHHVCAWHERPPVAPDLTASDARCPATSGASHHGIRRL